MSGRRVEVHVSGRLCDQVHHVFGGMDVGDRPPETIIRGQVDEDGLAELLARLRNLGLRVVSVRRVPDWGTDGPVTRGR